MEKEAQPKATLSTLLYLYPMKKTVGGKSQYETVTTSTAAQFLRAPRVDQESEKKPATKKESMPKALKAKESARFNFLGRFQESKEADGGEASPQGKRFRVTLIEEGLGNLGDCYYYTGAAIASCPPLFEGAHFFLDHPSESEETDRPERSVKDIAGYFENVSAVKDETGRMNLTGDAVLVLGPAGEQARALMKESLSFTLRHPGKELAGLSINASGDFDVVAIEQFMKEADVPEPCQPKLMEALQQGITMIRPVREMTSAVSCDLVTTAGAGGKINQLLEGEKQSMKQKKEMEAEEKGKEAGEKPAPKDAAGAGDSSDADGQTGGHADEEKDKDLIMSMLKKYVGDGFSDDDHSMAHEAYQNALEMGLEGKEAEACAGHNMKMAKHLQMKQAKQKQAEDDAGGVGDGKAIHDKPKAVGDAGHVDAKDQEESEEMKQKMHKESARKPSDKLVALTAENAALRSELETLKLDKHVDKILRESRLPMAATKRFRECIKDIKTQKEASDKLAIFKEAYNLGGEADGMGFILGAEKEGTISTGTTSFADCVDE